MANGQLYRRTKAGIAAWQLQDARVPLEYRRVLGAVDGDVHPDTLRGRVPFSAAGLADLLDELVEKGLLETVAAAETHDLDFTGNFSVADFRKAAGA